MGHEARGYKDYYGTKEKATKNPLEVQKSVPIFTLYMYVCSKMILSIDKRESHSWDLARWCVKGQRVQRGGF